MEDDLALMEFPGELRSLSSQQIDHFINSLDLSYDGDKYSPEGIANGYRIAKTFNTLADFEAVMKLRELSRDEMAANNFSKAAILKYNDASRAIRQIYLRLCDAIYP